jgi:hypothetical protein
MSAKKIKKTYHANTYTFDAVLPSGQKAYNFTDTEKRDAYEKRMEMGGVGPERISDYVKRYGEETKRLDKAEKGILTNQNKSRGTPSSSVRKIIK